MSRRFVVLGAGLLLVPMVWALACQVSGGVGSGGAYIAFTIGGKTFKFSLGDAGTFQARKGTTTTGGVRVTGIYDEAPTDTPPTAAMRVPSSSVAVVSRLPGKSLVRGQGLPDTGTATITLLVAPGSSTDPCNDGIPLATYDLTLTAGIVTIADEIADLSAAAIAIVATNDVTICVQITADFDADFSIGEIEISFGTAENPTPPIVEEEETDPTTGTLIQVPIDNISGQAIEAPVTLTVDGVDYGVVSVLEDHTPDVPEPVGGSDPNQVSINLNDLGLETVNRLYMGGAAAFVPDLPNGFRIATLTCRYAEGGTDTTVNLVMGENTAEWSYDRPEHVADYGGVQHDRPEALYSFLTTIDSAAEYTGYTYAVTLDLDNSRTLSCITLEIVDEDDLTAGGGTEGDEDGDGVPDDTDECPNTPAGTEVDEVGCPVDGGVTVDETFTGLAEATGGDTESPSSAADVPDAIISVIEEATAAGSSYDVMFIIDLTSSMGDDISAVKARLDDIINEMIANGDGSQRAGVVTYQDLCADGEDTNRLVQDLTTDLEAVRAAINGLSVSGGGDLPESVYDAIVYAMESVTFTNPNRFAMVIGDAPPQSPGDSCYRATYLEAVNAATAAGVDVNLYPIIVPTTSTFSFRARSQDPCAQYAGLGKAGLRMQRGAVAEPTWAAQAMLAITLEGPAGVPATVGSCEPTEVTVEDAFTDLADATGGETVSPEGASEVPDAIIEVIEEATAAGGSYDVAFIIDLTSSMSDDISAVKARLDDIINEMIANGDGSQRAGIVSYKDLCADGEDTVVLVQEMTNDLEAVRTAINGLSVSGGGDAPESVYDAIVYAMENLTFSNANRFAMVIGDAPPQSPGDSCYRASFEDAVDATEAAGADVNLYPIIVPGG